MPRISATITINISSWEKSARWSLGDVWLKTFYTPSDSKRNSKVDCANASFCARDIPTFGGRPPPVRVGDDRWWCDGPKSPPSPSFRWDWSKLIWAGLKKLPNKYRREKKKRRNSYSALSGSLSSFFTDAEAGLTCNLWFFIKWVGWKLLLQSLTLLALNYEQVSSLLQWTMVPLL